MPGTDATCVVSSFARLSLFAEQQLPFDGDVAVDRQNVVRDLELTPDELWQDFEPQSPQKRQPRPTLRLDGRDRSDRPAAWKTFCPSTTPRWGAAKASNSYYFPREFFETLVTELAGQFVFLHVLSAEHVVSTELVLVFR